MKQQEHQEEQELVKFFQPSTDAKSRRSTRNSKTRKMQSVKEKEVEIVPIMELRGSDEKNTGPCISIQPPGAVVSHSGNSRNVTPASQQMSSFCNIASVKNNSVYTC
jgi:hypothetical protein